MEAIDHEIKIDAGPEAVYEALSTLEGLRAWHTAEIEGSTELNSSFTIHATGKPLFQWKVVEAIPSTKIRWECLKGPGDSPGTFADYQLTPIAGGKTLVVLQHSGWPDSEGNFRKCNTLWGELLHHLKKYVESNRPEPAFK